MSRLLLMDFSNIAYATYYAMGATRPGEYDSNDQMLRQWKFMMLSSIKKNKLRHKPTEYVICCDNFSWRKRAFRYYKAKRDELRKEADFDYKFFVEGMDKFITELDEVFPYTVIKLKGAEADDIIGVLAQEMSGRFDEVIIASNDKDFKQLVRGNVRLFSMREDKFVKVEDPQEFLITHVLRGDSGDGIPNVRSDDDTFIADGKRQKPCGPKLIGKILEQGLDEWLDEQGLRRNWNRNRLLIDLGRDYVPKGLWEKVVEVYSGYDKTSSNYSKILGYMTKNRLRALVPEVGSFMMRG
jgi:5'-3' exonuclease